METNKNQDREIEIAFEEVELTKMDNGNQAHIFYFNVKNLKSKRAKFFVSRSTYKTAIGEEIDQDVWLSGLGNGITGISISGGAFKKIGCVHYTSKLQKFNIGDQIVLTGNAENGGSRCEFIFHCVDAELKKYELLSTSVELIPEEEKTASSSAKTPENSKQEITKIVERLDLLEDKMGVRFEGLYVVCTKRAWQTPADFIVDANFDVVGTGATLEHSFKTRLSAYNASGQLLQTSWNFINNSKFIGLESHSIQLICDEMPIRLRLFPSDLM